MPKVCLRAWSHKHRCTHIHSKKMGAGVWLLKISCSKFLLFQYYWECWTMLYSECGWSCFQAEETLSVYLEYVSGGSIYKLLQEYGPFKEPVIQTYTRQILSGLAYLHARNTVHRYVGFDLSNVFEWFALYILLFFL